jgi:hypothetical protein
MHARERRPKFRDVERLTIIVRSDDKHADLPRQAFLKGSARSDACDPLIYMAMLR